VRRITAINRHQIFYFYRLNLLHRRSFQIKSPPRQSTTWASGFSVCPGGAYNKNAGTWNASALYFVDTPFACPFIFHLNTLPRSRPNVNYLDFNDTSPYIRRLTEERGWSSLSRYANHPAPAIDLLVAIPAGEIPLISSCLLVVGYYVNFPVCLSITHVLGILWYWPYSESPVSSFSHVDRRETRCISLSSS